MGKTNFQYDETGNTYYYVFLTFLAFFLFPATYYLWPFGNAGKTIYKDSSDADEEKKKRLASVSAKDTVYYQACLEKAARLGKKDPWSKTRRTLGVALLLFGWVLFAMIIYQISQFDYEMANFDPYEILGVGLDASAKEIKKKYRELSLIYHPDKPTGSEKLFMKLNKAYNALTDETAKYNWEHYGNPDGPQAMQFGIGLPAWIVEEKNSIWVLGVYTLIFMVGLPTAVYYWWSNSSKFSGEQVLLDTTQLYYYFFHKTPHMMLRRVLMVLAASLEFEKGHNAEIVERPTDNDEIPKLMKNIPNLGVNNKEKPLCFGYSVKARALLFAHLSRISLPLNTLHQDRLYVIKKCPFLIHEMVTCISQLIMLAHAGRINRLPTLDTVENTMKLSPMIVQALWEKQSPLLQLPHIEEEHLKHFHSRKRNIKTLAQLAKMKDEDRRSLLRTLSEEQYRDVLRVLAMLPLLSIEVTTEVVDDEEQHVVTAGAIITVTVLLKRSTLETMIGGKGLFSDQLAEDGEDRDQDDDLDPDMVEVQSPEAEDKEEDKPAADEETKKKTPVWMKPAKKKAAKKGSGGGGKQKQKQKAKKANAANTEQTGENAQDKASEKTTSVNNPKHSKHRHKVEDGGSDGGDQSGSESDASDDAVHSEKAGEGAISTVDDEEDEEAEWEKFQKKMNKREKALEGKSRLSHSVHAPFFTDDKQEFWWVYIADKKNRALITQLSYVTSLVDQEEVELKFTAPLRPGHYSYTVCVRSDSYLGMDYQEDIKLDVKEAHVPVTEHPQWEFEDDDEESKDEESDDEFATDDEYEEDED